MPPRLLSSRLMWAGDAVRAAAWHGDEFLATSTAAVREFVRSSFVLNWAALLGFRITIWQIAALGWRPVVLLIALVALTILASIWLARRMGFNSLFGLLTGGATAICGASAAMAISAALPPDPQKERNTFSLSSACRPSRPSR